MGAKRRGKTAGTRPKRRASASKGAPRPGTTRKVKVPPPLPTLGAKKLGKRFGVSARTAAAWLAAGAPAARAADLKKAAGRSRRSKRAARTMNCRRDLLAFGKTAHSYKNRGVSGEFFDKERCGVLASAGDGTTLRLQILVGESGRGYPQWADAKKLEGYQNDPELNFAYQKAMRKTSSRLEIFFPECCGKFARASHEVVERESERSYQRTHPEWLKEYRRKKRGKKKPKKAARKR